MKGKLIFIILLAIMILSVSGVCASDVDNSDVPAADDGIQSGEGQILNAEEGDHDADGDRAVNNVMVYASNVTYGEQSYIGIYADVDGMYLLDVGGDVSNVTVSGGMGDTVLSLDAGSYCTNVTFWDGSYDTVVKNAEFHVDKAKNNVIVSVMDVTYGDESAIDLYAIVDGKYQVDINGTVHDIEVVDGTGSKSVSLSIGSYYANATFNNMNYETAAQNAVFNVNKAYGDVFVVVDVDKSDVEITVTTDANASGNVVLIVNGAEVGIKTVKEDKAIFNLKGLDDGRYSVEARYSGDGKYAPRSVNATFVVDAKVHDVRIVAPNRMVYVSDAAAGYVYQIILRDENGNPVADKEVIFSFNNMTQKATTGSNGWAKATLAANKEGSYDVTVTFNGDYKYNPATQTASIKLVRESTRFVAPNRAVYIMDMIRGYTYQAILKTKDGKALANKKVLITFNGKKQIAYTDENGYVAAKLNANQAGSHRIELKFAGDRYCNAVSEYRTINVIKQPTSVTVSPGTYSVGTNPKQITVTLKSNQGKLIGSGWITLKVGNAKYRAYTNSDGVATFAVKLSQRGIFKVTAAFEGSRYYEKSYGSATITVS